MWATLNKQKVEILAECFFPSSPVSPVIPASAYPNPLPDTCLFNQQHIRVAIGQLSFQITGNGGFSQPSPLSSSSAAEYSDCDQNPHLMDLLDKFKLMAKREETYTHLLVCWGTLTAALGLSSGVLSFLH
ncbi:hypothetical protein J132_10501 [Termitomyces sp. J132]|nr:hypothetical protein J132_10501 [Termitomyces sp. J132]